MMYKKQCSAYGIARETVGSVRRIVMLYDGIIKFAMQARHAIEENRIADRFNNLERACKILLGLQSCLDFTQGDGKIAHILFNFYVTTNLRMMALNQSRSVKDCDGIIQDLKKMRDTWEGISNSTSGGDAANTIPSQESLSAKLESVAVSI